MYETKLSARDEKLVKRIVGDFFKESPIQFNFDIGQEVTDAGQLILGCRAGISLDAFNLFHEMSHLVEIDDKRANAYGWGLYFGKEINIPGWPTFREPENWKATQREMRVMALQANLMKHFGRKPDFRYFAELCDHLVDYIMVPFKLETRHGIIAKRIEKLSQKPEYSFAAFKKEWARKEALLVRKLSKVDNFRCVG